MGIGLGLTISKGIAEALGGRIQVKSHFGSGSRFYLIIPENCEEFKEDYDVINISSFDTDPPYTTTIDNRDSDCLNK